MIFAKIFTLWTNYEDSGIGDSDRLWEELAMSNNMVRKPKYKKGDVVEIRSAVVESTGTVEEEIGVNSFGDFEYIVRFHDGRGVHYCYEDELKKVEGFHRSYTRPKCECGAYKVYGKNASKHHHALWCLVREKA